MGLGLLGLALWIYTVTNAQFLKMGPLGLVSILGRPYFIGLTLVALGFALELIRTPLRPARLIFLIVVVVVYIFGTACAIEPTAGLPSSWVHAGMVQYIYVHGHVLDNYRAEFSWPGAFSLGAVLSAFAGQNTALAMLRWFPLAIELTYLPPLLVIARYGGVGRRAGYLGVAVFYASDWIYQDYFSPQALNYLFYLVIIGGVLACWRPQPRLRASRAFTITGVRIEATRAAFRFHRLAGRDASVSWRSGTTLLILTMLGVICLASAISHQLTPYALVLSLLACLVTRRLGRPELILILALVSIGWLSLGASNFWEGHLSAIFGGFGQLGSAYASNVSSHVSGNSTHLLIVDSRILLTAAIYVLAAIGVLRRAPDSRAMELLAAAPVLLVAAQSYGGEGLLRVVFFALPFVSLLAASAVLPNRRGSIRPVVPRLKVYRHGRAFIGAGVLVMLLGCGVATSVVRGGNDTYESFSTGELAAVNYAYSHIHAGESIGVIGGALPIGQEDLGTVSLIDGASANVPTPTNTRKTLIASKAPLIILSRSEEDWGEQVGGFPVGWETKLKTTLLHHGYHVVAKWSTATVLQLQTAA
jgi:hypothetical protein